MRKITVLFATVLATTLLFSMCMPASAASYLKAGGNYDQYAYKVNSGNIQRITTTFTTSAVKKDKTLTVMPHCGYDKNRSAEYDSCKNANIYSTSNKEIAKSTLKTKLESLGIKSNGINSYQNTILSAIRYDITIRDSKGNIAKSVTGAKYGQNIIAPKSPCKQKYTVTVSPYFVYGRTSYQNYNTINKYSVDTKFITAAYYAMWSLSYTIS